MSFLFSPLLLIPLSQSFFVLRALNIILPSALAAVSAFILLSTLLYHFLVSSHRAIKLPLHSSQDQSLSPLVLEDSVLRKSALEIYGDEPELGKSIIEKLRDWTVLSALLAFLVLEIFIAVKSLAISNTAEQGLVVLAAYLTGLSIFSLVSEMKLGKQFGLFPYGSSVENHRTTLLFAGLFLKLINLRSCLIQSSTRQTLIFQSITSALVLFAVLIDIFTPYQSTLDGTLEGHRSRGRGFRKTSSDSKKIEMVEEPLSMVSRAFFAYMNPLIARHFKTAIKEQDVPQLREDDRAAVVVGGWREFRERQRRGLVGGQQGFGKGGLSWNLMVYFKKYLFLQIVRFFSSLFLG